MSSLFIGGISEKLSEGEIDEMFSKVGKVRKINLKGTYGFVEMDNRDECDEAIKRFHGIDLHGGKITVEEAKGKKRINSRPYGPPRMMNRPMRTDYRVTVDNIPSQTSWQELKDYMKKSGQVVFADIIKDRYGKAKYGIVEYRYYDDMKYACKSLDDQNFNGKYIRVEQDRERRDYRSGPRYRERRDYRSAPYGYPERRRRYRSRSKSYTSQGSRSLSPPPKKSNSPPPKDYKKSNSNSPNNNGTEYYDNNVDSRRSKSNSAEPKSPLSSNDK